MHRYYANFTDVDVANVDTTDADVTDVDVKDGNITDLNLENPEESRFCKFFQSLHPIFENSRSSQRKLEKKPKNLEKF